MTLLTAGVWCENSMCGKFYKYKFASLVDNEPCGAPLLPDSTLPRSVFSQEADFVLAFATVPGYVSFRLPDSGTFFIQTLVEVIRKYHHRHHFLEILTEVTKLVVERQNKMEHPVQVPAPVHTLTNLLYL
ncbi:caspase-3-like [Oculina patagonica]